MNAAYTAVIYARVSKDTEQGRSVEDQERECRAECERKGWAVRKVFRDNNISASRYGKARPEWESLKRELRKGDVLVLWEASRAARDLEEFVRLRDMCAELGVPVSYSGRVMDLSLGDDRFVGGLDALIAERESEQIRVRTLRGKRSGAAAGRPAGRVPWGYRVASPGVWVHDPVEAPRIKEAVERIIAGESHSAVYRWLQDTQGYVPPTLTVMSRSLKKASLAGLRVHQGEVIGKGNWEPIVTEEQHRLLLARMERIRRTHGMLNLPGPEPRRLLSLIATCAECGSGLSFRNRPGSRRSVYVCPRSHCSRLADPLDKAVEEQLFDRLSRVDPTQFEDDEDPEVEGLWEKIEELEKKLSEYTEEAIAGRISAGSFGRIEQGLTEQIEALKARAVRDGDQTIELADLRQNWQHMSVRDKRSVIRGFFRITVHPAKRGHSAGLGGVEIVPL